jgi:glutamyl-tRNA reductase
VVACTGSTGVLVTTRHGGRAGERPLAVVDLALPHDVEPEVAELAGVTLVDLADLAEELAGSEPGARSRPSATSSTQEVAAFLAARRQASVTPTVVALRSMATGWSTPSWPGSTPGCPTSTRPPATRCCRAVRRVADKLLHQPTVRVKELANETGAVSYAAALAELFALDPDAVDAVTRPEGLA